MLMAKTVYDVRIDNLRALIEECGGAAAAAAKLDMDPSQLSQIAGRNPTRNIGDQIARRIEVAFGKPQGWLDFPHDQQGLLAQPGSEYNVSNEPLTLRRVPLISWVQAGQWRDVIDNLQPGDSYDSIATTARVGPNAYALRVIGDSMTNPAGAPSFPEGTVIIVDPDRNAEPGKFVVVRQNDDRECTFKQLVRDGGKMYLKPLNPRYPIMEMLADAIICGVAVRAEFDL